MKTFVRCLVVAAAGVAGVARGDVVIKSDGTRIEGKIVQEDANVVVVQYNIGEIQINEKVAQNKIKSIARDAKPDATYCVIPIHGEIGTAVKAAWVQKALDQARSHHPDYVVLDIDSPGGEIGEMHDIIDVLKASDAVKMVAFVKRAISAAGMIALTCQTIVLKPEGEIGAAVPWHFAPDGSAQAADAKFRAIMEAKCRQGAEHGGHSPLFVDAMVEMDSVVSKVQVGKGVQLVEGKRDGATLLKKSGNILMLQGKEAIDCGLAAGLASDLPSASTFVGVKTWAEVGGEVAAYMEKQPRIDRIHQEAQEKKIVQTMQKITILRGIEEDRARLSMLQEQKKEVDATLDGLVADAQREADKVRSTFNNSTKDATAQNLQSTGMSAIARRYQPRIDAAKRESDAIRQQMADVTAHVDALKKAIDEN